MNTDTNTPDKNEKQELVIPYPFILERNVDMFDVDTGRQYKANNWRPGIDYAPVRSQYDDGGEAFCDEMGEMLITEIDRHKLPSPYPERVFFVRRWRTPKGKIFGKTQLRITTKANFTKLCKGYRHPFYDMSEQKQHGDIYYYSSETAMQRFKDDMADYMESRKALSNSEGT